MIDLLHEIGQTLTHNKMRTALTGVAVAWGIFMLIVLLGLSRGVINAFEEDVRGQGSNTLELYGGTTSEPWRGYKLGRNIELREPDAAAIERQNGAHVAAVTPKIQGPARTLSTARDYVAISYSGVYPSEQAVQGITMLHGRFVNSADIDQSRKVMVLAQPVAETLFADVDQAVGSMVKYGDIPFRVVGVFESRWDRTVYVPYTTARRMAGGGNDVNSMRVALANVNTEAEGNQAEEEVRATMAALHEFNPADRSAVNVWNQFTQHAQMATGMNIINLAMWVIGILTLLSGIIGVSNIMFVSVNERTHEIGIRRAIGARPAAILRQIILESVSITTLFGYVGIVLGTAATELIGSVVGEANGFKNPGVDLSICFEVTLVLIIAGALAGLFPALKALKVKPVEALREE